VGALTVLALTRPDVAFSVISDERALIDCPPAARLIDRVRALWGVELADTLLEVSHRAGPLEVTGLVQRPAQARPAGRKGYVFVRGRPIRDPFILRAAEAGYRSTIAPGDRPSLLPSRQTSIRSLVARAAPASLPQSRLPFERHVYSVTAAVTLVR